MQIISTQTNGNYGIIHGALNTNFIFSLNVITLEIINIKTNVKIEK